MKNIDYVKQMTSHEMSVLFENLSNNKCAFCTYQGQVVCKRPAGEKCRDGFQTWLMSDYGQLPPPNAFGV